MSQPGRIPFLRRNALRGLALATLWAAGALALPGCTAVAFGIANVPALVGNYERHAGLRYAAGPRHSLDVYVPYGAALAPVVVFWYGGAWTSGDKADYRFVGASLWRHCAPHRVFSGRRCCWPPPSGRGLANSRCGWRPGR